MARGEDPKVVGFYLQNAHLRLLQAMALWSVAVERARRVGLSLEGIPGADVRLAEEYGRRLRERTQTEERHGPVNGIPPTRRDALPG